MSCRPLRWLPIQLAPEDCDLEVGELDKTGIMPLGFPCRRNLGVWYNAWADEPILIFPTHWRIWRANKLVRVIWICGCTAFSVDRTCNGELSILIGVHPLVGRDLPRLRQLDHMHGRRVTTLPARTTFERSLQLPERCFTGTPDRVERQARPRFAAVAPTSSQPSPH
jgi:hypothetical protein